MKTATVLKLKASLGDYLKSVKAGEEIAVLPSADGPSPNSVAKKSEDWVDRLIEMEKQGLIKLGFGKLPKGFWKLPRPKDPKG